MDVNDRLSSIESRLVSLETSKAVDEVHRVNVEKRLESIETTLRWLVYLILGSVVTAVLNVVIRGGI